MAAIQYYSTNKKAGKVSLSEALLKGQAPDKGLYLPEEIPQVSKDDLSWMKGKSYPEIAALILNYYSEGNFSESTIQGLCKDAYNYDIPLEKVCDRTYVMRLDQGPTASFKDFAARMMARLFSQLMEQRHQELVILTATSGDTGSAIAHAFYKIPNIKVMVLFPPDEVSNRQRKQMTTLGENITLVGVDGKFDDCQALVKEAFSDPSLDGIHLTSANSINIGRLLPQTVYYFYAWSQLAETDEEITFSIPSGNFGDMMGAILAKSMGLPIKRLIIATNANDEVPEFLRTESYNKIVPSRNCISNAMNVGHPSNLARLVDVYGGWMDEIGTLHKLPDMNKLHQDLWTTSIDDQQTRDTIVAAYKEQNLILEPHGAVGWAALQTYQKKFGKEDLMVSVETAHPAKFPEEIEKLLELIPDVPESLKNIEDKDEHYLTMDNDYEAFHQLLKRTYLT